MDDTLESGRCAQLLKAIADPERLRIIQCLRRGPRAVSQIADDLHQELVNVSHHLGVLRQAHLVLTEKQGRHVIYSLNPEFFPTGRRGAHQQRIDFGCCRLEMP